MIYGNILLVDDCDVDRYLLRRQLKKISLGENILEAEHGKQALGVLQRIAENESKPSLILLDINMPIMNGFEFLEAFSKLRSSDKFSKRDKVVMMSSSDITEDKIRASEHEFVMGYITKCPESPESFKENIEKLISFS